MKNKFEYTFNINQDYKFIEETVHHAFLSYGYSITKLLTAQTSIFCKPKKVALLCINGNSDNKNPEFKRIA